MRTIFDPVSGRDVSIGLVGNIASIACNGRWLNVVIRPSDLSMARVALTKRDLSAFGSFFDEPLKSRRAA